MLDKLAMSARFFSCYPNHTRVDLAREFGVTPGAVANWANCGTIPWGRLKYLADSQALSWNWIIEGWAPKEGAKRPKTDLSTIPVFNLYGINDRYFSLISGQSQKTIAEKVGVSPSMLSHWKMYKEQVPWVWLDKAVHTYNVNWDWLLEGVEPKYRKQT